MEGPWYRSVGVSLLSCSHVSFWCPLQINVSEYSHRMMQEIRFNSCLRTSASLSENKMKLLPRNVNKTFAFPLIRSPLSATDAISPSVNHS